MSGGAQSPRHTSDLCAGPPARAGPVPAHYQMKELIMAAFTAADVKALRERTGSGIMDCKRALAECDGDIDKSIEHEKKGTLQGATSEAPKTIGGTKVSPTLHKSAVGWALLPVQGRWKQRFLNCRQISLPVRF